MKQIQPELHRLTALQRQILKWIRLEGGGCLPIDRLFTSIFFTQSQANPDPFSLGERVSEAIEQLTRSGLTEVRYERPVKGKFASLYDFGSLANNLEMNDEDRWEWTGKDLPEVALTDFGSHYAARMT